MTVIQWRIHVHVYGRLTSKLTDNLWWLYNLVTSDRHTASWLVTVTCGHSSRWLLTDIQSVDVWRTHNLENADHQKNTDEKQLGDSWTEINPEDSWQTANMDINNLWRKDFQENVGGLTRMRLIKENMSKGRWRTDSEEFDNKKSVKGTLTDWQWIDWSQRVCERNVEALSLCLHCIPGSLQRGWACVHQWSDWRRHLRPAAVCLSLWLPATCSNNLKISTNSTSC